MRISTCWLTSPLSLLLIAAGPLAGQLIEFRSPAKDLAKDCVRQNYRTLAVADFTDEQGNSSVLGRYLADEFALEMTRTREKVQIMDRTQAVVLLKEQKLALNGLIDASTARKLGEIARVDGVVTGTITQTADAVHIVVKALSVRNWGMVGSAVVDVGRSGVIAELIKRPPPAAPKPDNPKSGGGGGGGGGTTASGDSSTGQPQDNTPRPNFTVAEFKFELQGCKAEGTNVRCAFMVTNIGRDRNLTIRCDESRTDQGVVRMVDGQGVAHGAAECTLVNQRSVSTPVPAFLVKDIPVPSSYQFRNVSASVDAIPLLTVSGAWEDQTNGTRGDLRVDFRNVRVAR